MGQVPAKRFVDPGRETAAGAFAPGVMVGKTLYIAGKGDYRPNAEFPEKVKNCLGEIRKTLQAVGMDMEQHGQVVRLPGRPRQVRRDEQVLRRVLPGQPARADDAGRRPGAGRLAGRDHLHRLRRPGGAEGASAAAGRASRTAPGSWRATRSTSRARGTSSPTADTRRRSRSRSGRRCGTSRRRSSRRGWTSGMSS